jgi:acetyl-CoA C-acetyltransferase
MRDVFIIGVGHTAVGEHWDRSLRDLGTEAIFAALKNARLDRVDALMVGNMLAGTLNGQENVGTAMADAAGLLPVEAWKVEAACASGAAAVRAAVLGVASGAHEVALALGVEKMTDGAPEDVTASLATASDQDFEASHGLSFVGLSALLMQRYLHESKKGRDAFAPFAVNAHRNAVTNVYAMFREPISAESFGCCPLVASPIGVLDAAPVCDGAAAVLVCSSQAIPPGSKPVKVSASTVATDTLALAHRRDLLTLEAAAVSAEKAYRQSGLGPKDMHLFEAHDAFTIISALSLEACGFAKRGQAVELAAEGGISPSGRIPISTFGGLKARGHPVGASGAYQIVEAVLQLRGEAGKNQISRARRALTQSIGGHGSVAVTHILEA